MYPNLYASAVTAVGGLFNDVDTSAMSNAAYSARAGTHAARRSADKALLNISKTQDMKSIQITNIEMAKDEAEAMIELEAAVSGTTGNSTTALKYNASTDASNQIRDVEIQSEAEIANYAAHYGAAKAQGLAIQPPPVPKVNYAASLFQAGAAAASDLAYNKREYGEFFI